VEIAAATTGILKSATKQILQSILFHPDSIHFDIRVFYLPALFIAQGCQPLTGCIASKSLIKVGNPLKLLSNEAAI
jgi:hypothetical protein